MKKDSAFKVSLTAMFAAIICAGCFIRIPVGAVPVVIQNVLCILTGTILGGDIIQVTADTTAPSNVF